MSWPPSPKSAGGKARAAALSPDRRSAIASGAAKARWSGEAPKRRNAHPEADVQKEMVQFLDLALPQPSADYWWSATLNGVRLKTPRARGQAAEQGLRPGLYDLLFVKLTGEDAGQTYHFEVKGPDGRLTAEQKVLMDALWPTGRGASGKTVESLCAALVAWDFPLRARI
jgi:hypothetical protein